MTEKEVEYIIWNKDECAFMEVPECLLDNYLNEGWVLLKDKKYKREQKPYGILLIPDGDDWRFEETWKDQIPEGARLFWGNDAREEAEKFYAKFLANGRDKQT